MDEDILYNYDICKLCMQVNDDKRKLAQLENKQASTGAALREKSIDLNNLAGVSRKNGQDIDLLRSEKETVRI